MWGTFPILRPRGCAPNGEHAREPSLSAPKVNKLPQQKIYTQEPRFSSKKSSKILKILVPLVGQIWWANRPTLSNKQIYRVGLTLRADATCIS